MLEDSNGSTTDATPTGGELSHAMRRWNEMLIVA